ncbi:chemotaxis protein CheW [Pleionea sp. CnH1-48]|uniref:chemotaxis protein CheW n=1 Tax=Pleionea sp. CnH1-48 TaxID=2954494 RepID=UPI002097F2F5|nr:chemotaxis protein CheW [Pleionea sp. CnH1-48]MCO7226090.1 chemotaxis protein CheW [Pleionea sp. CnH1-48]
MRSIKDPKPQSDILQDFISDMFVEDATSASESLETSTTETASPAAMVEPKTPLPEPDVKEQKEHMPPPLSLVENKPTVEEVVKPSIPEIKTSSAKEPVSSEGVLLQRNMKPEHSLAEKEKARKTMERLVDAYDHGLCAKEKEATPPEANNESVELADKLKDVEQLLARIPLKPQAKVVEKTEAPVETPVEVQPKPDIAEPTVEEAKEEDAKVDVATEHDSEHRIVQLSRNILGDRFQTLVFEVGKLPLAVPLQKLGGIHAYSDEDITPLFGSPDWFMGLIPSEQGNIMLVDTARLIMPEKYAQIEDQLNYDYAILLDDTRWALACTQVRDAKTLTHDDIRWAQKGTQKEWFAGMVVQFMCALLEVDSLINLLYRSGVSRKIK